jgi:hypothetical protein
MDPRALKQLHEGVDRCRRVNGKLAKIQRDYDECDKKYRNELDAYFEHWDSFTEKEVLEFCTDISFEMEYEHYLAISEEMQDNDHYDEEVPKVGAVAVEKDDRWRYLFSDEPDSDPDLGF